MKVLTDSYETAYKILTGRDDIKKHTPWNVLSENLYNRASVVNVYYLNTGMPIKVIIAKHLDDKYDIDIIIDLDSRDVVDSVNGSHNGIIETIRSLKDLILESIEEYKETVTKDIIIKSINVIDEQYDGSYYENSVKTFITVFDNMLIPDGSNFRLNADCIGLFGEYLFKLEYGIRQSKKMIEMAHEMDDPNRYKAIIKIACNLIAEYIYQVDCIHNMEQNLGENVVTQ